MPADASPEHPVVLVGTVTGPAGRPVAGATVAVVALRGAGAQVAATDERGGFSLPLPGGTHAVVAWCDGCRPGAALVSLPAGRAEVGLALHATGRAEGRVTLARTGAPAVDVAVELACEGRPARHTMTDRDGRFAFPAADAGPATITAYRKGYRPEELPVRVEPGGVVDGQISLVPVGPLAGRVWTSDGRPAGAGSVSALGPDGQVLHRVDVRDGRFAIDEIASGPVLLVALAGEEGRCLAVDTGAQSAVDLRLIDRSPIELRGASATASAEAVLR